jgi:trk system potassium uptake protein TrkA
VRVIIMGCGRTGAAIAEALDLDDHSVTIIDRDAKQFRRLAPEFSGTRVVANGMDQKDLETAGINEADAFIAVTQGDNRNYFASQLASEIYKVEKVLCRVKDPQREVIFRQLGIKTYSPTSSGATTMIAMLLGEKGS